MRTMSADVAPDDLHLVSERPTWMWHLPRADGAIARAAAFELPQSPSQIGPELGPSTHLCRPPTVLELFHDSEAFWSMATLRPNRRLVSATAGIAALLSLVACETAWAAEPKRVMLLHSFGRDFKPWSEYAKAIREQLDRRSPWPLDLREHSLEIARSSDENPEGPFVEYLRSLFAKQQPDLIVSIGAPAAAFVQRHRQQLFPTTPMLLTVVDQRRVQYSVLTANDAVAAVSINYFAAVENILRVLPNTKNVAVVVGSSPIEKFWREEIGKEVQPFANRIAFTWYNHLSFEEILKHAAALPPQSAIFWELMIVDAAGVVHEEGKALARLHAVANAPIFSYTDAFFGREIVGGPHVPVLEHGRQVAEVAVRILNGERPSDIKMSPVGFGTPKFDWREMQRWGISESHLPPGSEIYFREPDRMGAISCADSGDLRCPSGAGRVDRLADLRASASPPCGGHGAQFHGRTDSYESRSDSGGAVSVDRS